MVLRGSHFDLPVFPIQMPLLAPPWNTTEVPLLCQSIEEKLFTAVEQWLLIIDNSNLQSYQKLESAAASVREIADQPEEFRWPLALDGHVDLVAELRRRRVEQLSQDGFRFQI